MRNGSDGRVRRGVETNISESDLHTLYRNSSTLPHIHTHERHHKSHIHMHSLLDVGVDGGSHACYAVYVSHTQPPLPSSNGRGKRASGSHNQHSINCIAPPVLRLNARTSRCYHTNTHTTQLQHTNTHVHSEYIYTTHPHSHSHVQRSTATEGGKGQQQPLVLPLTHAASAVVRAACACAWVYVYVYVYVLSL